MMTPRTPYGGAGPLLSLLLLVGMLGTMAYIAFWPTPQHPEVLPRLAGCYRPGVDQQGPVVRIDDRGKLYGPGFVTKVIVTESKDDLAFLPERQVYWTDTAPHVVLTAGYPLLLRISRDGNDFEMLGDKETITFRRSLC